MSELQECAQCHKPASTRCSRCKLLFLCSHECLKKIWKSHKADCRMIQLSREATPNGGANPETLVSIPLAMPEEAYTALFAPCEAVRARHAATEARMDRGDASLPAAEKVRYYIELLQVLDTSGNEHEGRTLVQKMALNRRYNTVYRDATTRLQDYELSQLHHEMQHRRIGAHFKQQARDAF